MNLIPDDSAVSEDARARGPRDLWTAYLELAKARLASMVILTAMVGYVLGARGAFEPLGLLYAVIGTALSAFGANILNQVLEEDRDRRMLRTRNRPLPAGRISRSLATTWGIASSVAGVTLLAATTNGLTAGLSLFTIVLYVAVYTPLKTRTSLNTVVGAVCGAILHLQKSKRRIVTTLEVGTFQAKEVRKVCRVDRSHPVIVSERLARLVPRGQGYGYDLIVQVGLAR